MSNLDKLIEWMEYVISINHYGDFIESAHIERITYKKVLEKAKQLQKEEPKTYTQEDLVKLEDAVEFANWANDVAVNIDTHLWEYNYQTNIITTKELFEIYKSKDNPLKMTNKTNPNDQAYANESNEGLTKREYFASLAMEGLAAFPGYIGGKSNPKARDVAAKAIEYADELIIALNKE